jgi:hypothetical protein
VFSLLSCYFGHLELIEPAILHLLLGDVLADGFGIPSNRINEETSGPNPLPSVRQDASSLLRIAAVFGILV